ncbi:hypothetical protein BDV38DRAFT_99555 [Aspergillus pseudotamarii]|uniref:Uncharacterized protein n=1 Tax=Aspergillus pseudotamarii TaxID=132259 RepID=A0A5N6ST91_ASPPS|nr:uncharacterized protein BDV38DRAFT_99555 [Aspergillus pseudotamarii]KAE8137039.1 hypothetical protein BDV38DRAFT_99555 [Aspergillus pseudotamarii]
MDMVEYLFSLSLQLVLLIHSQTNLSTVMIFEDFRTCSLAFFCHMYGNRKLEKLKESNGNHCSSRGVYIAPHMRPVNRTVRVYCATPRYTQTVSLSTAQQNYLKDNLEPRRDVHVGQNTSPSHEPIIEEKLCHVAKVTIKTN